MNLGLSGRVAIIAGASQGLGRAVAEAFAAEGVALALCSRNSDSLKKTAAEIRKQHRVAIETRAVDVSHSDDLRRFVEEIAQVFGRIDICVPNAGGPPERDFLAATDADWQLAFDSNLRSCIVLAQAVLPHMQRQKWGRIVAVTSMAVRQPLPHLVLSNTLRAGLPGLLRTISNEFAGDGITANNVAPGYTLTDRLKQLKARQAAESGKSEEEIEQLWIKEIPAGRLAQPEEIADAVVWLASERAAFITGQTIVVDGGMWKGV